MVLKRPSAGEAHFLRILLDHRAARGYDDLKVVDGVMHSSFAETCVALGLVAKEGESDHCMQQAIRNLRSPAQLRSLFVLLIN